MLLSDFSAAIYVGDGGYRWADGGPDTSAIAAQGIRRKSDLTQEILNAANLHLIEQQPGTGRGYSPFRDSPGLFRDFAKLEPSPAAILAFADRHGPLITPPPARGDVSHGSLLWYQDSIARLSDAVALWECLTQCKASKDRSCLGRWIQWKGGRLTWTWRVSHTASDSTVNATKDYSDGELIRPAEGLLFFLLQSHMHPRIQGQPERPIATVSITPHANHVVDFGISVNNLIDVLWLQFAFAVRGDKRFGECQACGGSFEIKGKRTSKVFCSTKCRMHAHRARWQKVAELHRLGKGPKAISKQVGIPEKAIKEWLKENG